MGRPRKAPSDLRTEQVKLLFTREDRERLDLLAELNECRVATLLAQWVDSRLRREYRALLKTDSTEAPS